ncbi:nucleoredoxin-like [Photinus pyralis]|nr:nucleoredoxin-like [Photinus pyralis]
MPWLAIPWQQISIRAELAQLYGIRGIPTLLLLDRNGHLITMDARTELAEDPVAQNFPWKPRAVNILTERFATKLHDYPAIILFVEAEETEVQFGESVLTPAADAYYKRYNINFNAPQEEFVSTSGDDHYLQFLVGVDTETSDILRDLIGLDDVVPLLVAVDIPNHRFAIMDYGVEITADSVIKFVDRFEKADLQFRNISQRVLESDNIVNHV